MKIEYDPSLDLLYVWFAEKGTKSQETKTIATGVFADFDANGKLIGIEILDASEASQNKLNFEFNLVSSIQKEKAA